MKKVKWMMAIALVAMIGLVGCKTKLEPGGAYAPTNELGQVQENLPFEITDLAWKMTYDVADSVFSFERRNRVTLWNISPDIKHTLDKLRPKFWSIVQAWARARKAYEEYPSPAGLDTANNVVTELQRLLPAIQAAIPESARIKVKGQ